MSIRQYRSQAGKSREQVAVDTNVSAKSVARWESGQAVPRASHLVPLAKSLGVPLARILESFDIGGAA